MSKKAKPDAPRSWRPAPEDKQILQDLQKKLGVNMPALLRMGLRKLAEAEGLR